MKAFRAFLLPLCLALLSGCVASYRPHLSDSAGKVRIKMTGGTSVIGQLWPVVDGKCDERVLLPQLLAFAEPATGLTRRRDGSEMAPSYARAGMQGSPDPARSNVSELQLAPGRYVFALLNVSSGYGSTMWQCGVNAVADIEPRRQYEIELRLEGDSAARQCRIVATRLDEQGGHASWRAYGLLGGKACPS